MKRFYFIAILLLSVLGTFAQKREFRGAWIQAVNGQFQGLPTQVIQQKLSRQLDVLKADGVNAIIFQVRPECDALYKVTMSLGVATSADSKARRRVLIGIRCCG